MATQPTHHLAALVGANLAAARKAKGLSQQQLATELETSISRVSSWERGLSLPNRAKHPKLAELLFDGDQMALFQSEALAA